MNDRRDFLKTVAKGAVYAAPVVYTLSTPRELRAIVTSGMFMTGRSQVAPGAQPATQQGVQAPWATPPENASPWTTPPPWGTQPGSPGGEE